ncbi:MAG: hypothetical protein IJV22_07715 [Bacteroidales bacterium]|nr:hypothetical protein [Bacteroidales bacterium]
MKIRNPFTTKRVSVSDEVVLPISRHFYYNAFGVRGRYEVISSAGSYLCTHEPGVGFFVRPNDSRTYQQFVHEIRDKQRQNFLSLLLRKEPNLDKIIEQAEHALKQASGLKRDMLSAYINCLLMLKDDELQERIIRAIKDRVKEKRESHMVSLLSHYKSIVKTLEHDIRSAQRNIKDELNEDQLGKWEKVVKAFHGLVDARRLWSVEDNEATGKASFHQVFADMGIFQFIQSPFDTPLLRDHRGNLYYLYPTGIVRARSAIDFDFIGIDQFKVVGNVVDMSTMTYRPSFNAKRKHKHHASTHTDALSTLYGTSSAHVLGELSIPEIGLRLYCNRTGPVEDFTKAFNEYCSC